MTYRLASLPAILALFLLLLAITACDSTPAPTVNTPLPASPTEAPATSVPTASDVTPDAPTPEVLATETTSETDTPTIDEVIPPPVPTDTEIAAAAPTPKISATAKAIATKIKRTATPEPTTQPVPGASTYIFPVQPPDVTSYGQFHHDYPATDIFCPIGSKFVAPIDGVVDYVSYKDVWDPAVNDPATRGGLSVAIIGVDGVRYYGSHLSEIADGIAPGVEVKAGDLLGRTGKTGDARFVDPHVHFGISHPTTPDDWEVRRGEISPYKYLQAWQAGKTLKPVIAP